MPERNKVLISGSSGMLGIDLCEELERDYGLYGVDKVKSHESRVKKFVECDITDAGSISAAVKEIGPDIVIHTAAMTDVDGCETDEDKAYKINAEGTKNIALACNGLDAVLIYISTDFVFDGRKKTPYKESDKTGPLGIYGDSKLKGEEAIKALSEKYFILRTSWLYGAHGKNFVDTIVAKAKTEKMLRVVDDQVGSPTYTKDLAVAIHRLLDKINLRHYGIYHVSNSGSVSWYEYAKEILTLAGSDVKVEPISSKELNRPAKRPAMSVLDNTKFQEYTGYKMRGWAEALREYLKKGRTC